MLATEFGDTLKSLVEFLTNLTKEDSARLKAEIKADDNLRRKIGEVVELTQRLVGKASETGRWSSGS